MKRILLFLIACLFVFETQADNIVFQDPVVKSLCVNNWDTDGDGELSYEEAAAVTSLGEVFKGNKNITSFTELEYFTGLSSIGAYSFYDSTIKEVAFPSSITSIDKYSFQKTLLGPTLTIPGNVKRIGTYAFAGCFNIRHIFMQEGMESIGYNSFTGAIYTMSIPSTINYIAAEAFNPYLLPGSSTNIDSQLLDGDFYLFTHNATPITVQRYAFRQLFSDGHLVVPYGSKEVYASTLDWQNFQVILEYGDVNEDGFVNIADVVAVVNHILGKENAHFNELIADVNGDGTINIADVIAIIDCILSD